MLPYINTRESSQESIMDHIANEYIAFEYAASLSGASVDERKQFLKCIFMGLITFQ